ncbi:MAG: response regulator [Kiritimatiellales bacterium]
MNKPISVAIVDDHRSTRDLIAELISEESRFACVGVYSDAEDAMAALPGIQPDIVLMDINMPGKNGIECVRDLKPKMPDTCFIMLTVYDQSAYIFRALAAGAIGYLLKRSVDTELIKALDEAIQGGAPMDGHIARLVVQSFQKAEQIRSEETEIVVLSDREQEVLTLLIKGKVPKEIADELNISVNTVYTYTRRTYEKLHVNSRVEAVAKFIGMGLPYAS